MEILKGTNGTTAADSLRCPATPSPTYFIFDPPVCWSRHRQSRRHSRRRPKIPRRRPYRPILAGLDSASSLIGRIAAVDTPSWREPRCHQSMATRGPCEKSRGGELQGLYRDSAESCKNCRKDQRDANSWQGQAGCRCGVEDITSSESEVRGQTTRAPLMHLYPLPGGFLERVQSCYLTSV